MFRHVAPRRIGGVGGNLQCQVAVAIVGETAHKLLNANDTRADVALEVVLGFGDDILHDAVGFTSRHHAIAQRQDVGRHGVVVIASFLSVPELLVEGDARGVHLLLPEVEVDGAVTERRELLHQAGHHIIGCRTHQRSRRDAGTVFGVDEFGLLRRHAPVAVGVVGDDVSLRQILVDMSHIALHGRIVGADGRHVAKLFVDHVRSEEEGRRPGDVVAEHIPIDWRHVGDTAIGLLVVLDVLQPFSIKQMVIEDIAFADAACGTVAKPPHALVALRTVGGHSAVVASDAPIGIAVDAVDDVVGALETACNGHLIIHHLTSEVVQLWFLSESTQFNIAEAMIDELRLPQFRALSRGDVAVGAEGRAQVGDVEFARWLQRLGKKHLK